MKIALLAPPYLPVPPKGYGGTERIVSALAEGLVSRGHDVTLFAAGDSKTSAKLYPTVAHSIGNSGEIKNSPLIPLLSYIDCFRKAHEFDLIHNHAQYVAFPLADLVTTPVVHTIHGSFYLGEVPSEKRETLLKFKHHRFISISHNQKQGLPELNWVGTVYNGIDIKEYDFCEKRGDYLLWVGRITRKKGILEAIEVAEAVGMKLKVAAAVDPIEESFYWNEVEPLFKKKNVEFIGEISDKKGRGDLYKNAYCTLYPISWHEPFGLVMVESMAAGTPVVAFDIGSVPEIVSDGISGFVVKNTDEMIAAVQKGDTLSRAVCREHVVNNFTTERMVEGYERVYESLICRLGTGSPD